MYTTFWFFGEKMITVVKRSPLGEEMLRYPAEVHTRLENGIVLDAYWNNPNRDLGYTIFETGDHFIEYYYTDRWFNIFAIASADGRRKGWYCNVAEPASISEERVEHVDLLLDVWVGPDGRTLILDEDEFAADTMLSEEQRNGARLGLRDLLALIEARHKPFAELR